MTAIITLPDALQSLNEKDCPGRYRSQCPHLQTSVLTLQPYMSSASSTQIIRGFSVFDDLAHA